MSSCARPQQLAEQVYLVHKYSHSFLHRKGYYGPEVLHWMKIFKSCVEVFVSSCALRNAAIKSSAGLFCINTTFLFCIFIYGPEVFPPHVDPDGVHLGVVVTLLGL